MESNDMVAPNAQVADRLSSVREEYYYIDGMILRITIRTNCTAPILEVNQLEMKDRKVSEFPLMRITKENAEAIMPGSKKGEIRK